MLRFLIIFGWVSIVSFLIEFFFGESNLSKNIFLYSLIFSAFVTILSFLSEISKKLSNKTITEEDRDGNKYDLKPFNDAVADELMRIRSDLVSLKLHQGLFCEDIVPPMGTSNSYERPGDWFHARSCYEFLHMWWMCLQYPSWFVCELYNTPDGSYAKIIILLGDIYPDEICSGQEAFNAEMLSKIHSEKIYKFKKDMNLTVLVCEPKEIDYPEEIRKAKILSVNKNTKDWGFDSITLEINLNHFSDMPSFYEKGKIIRTVEIRNNKYCELIFDNEKTSKNIVQTCQNYNSTTILKNLIIYLFKSRISKHEKNNS